MRLVALLFPLFALANGTASSTISQSGAETFPTETKISAHQCVTLRDSGASDVNAKRLPFRDLASKTLESNGYTLVESAWTPPKQHFLTQEKAWRGRRSEIKNANTMVLQCKAQIWSQLRATALRILPSCWREVGEFEAACEGKKHASCVATTGCQWNPVKDVRLLNELYCEHDQTENEFEFCMGPRMAELSQFYRRGGVSKTKQGELNRRKNANAHKGDPVMKREGRPDEDCFAMYTEATEPDFPFRSTPNFNLHIDANEPHVRNSLAFIQFQEVSLLGTQKELTDAIEEDEEYAYEKGIRLGYAMEAYNFWGPLEEDMLVSPLGMRDEGTNPANPETPHSCASSAAKTVNYAALKAGMAWMFKTGYTMHTALDLYDPAIINEGEASLCRTSFEFRFYPIVGHKPRKKNKSNLKLRGAGFEAAVRSLDAMAKGHNTKTETEIPFDEGMGGVVLSGDSIREMCMD